MDSETKPKIGKIIKMLWPHIAKNKWIVLATLAMGIITASFSVAEPVVYGQILDRIISALTNDQLGEGLFQGIIPLLLFWGGLVVGGVIVDIGYIYSAWWIANQSCVTHLSSLFRHILRFDLRRFQNEKSGSLLKRFDAGWEAQFSVIATLFENLYLSAARFMIGNAIQFYLDWRLALIALIPVPLILFTGYINYRYARQEQDRLSRLYEDIYGFVGDVMANIATVKSFVREKVSHRIMNTKFIEARQRQDKVNWVWSGAGAAYGALFMGGRLLIFASGVGFVANGSMTVGTLITFLGMAGTLFNSIRVMVSSFPNLLKDLVSLERARLLWEEQPEIISKPDAVKIRKVEGDIAFKNVSFAYNEKDALKNIDFEIPAGRMVALVGESGAGKSTLSKLLLRFEDPTKGSIELDGRDIRDIHIQSLRKNIGLVMQDNLLFHDTILANIKLAKPSATKKEVIAAAKRAQAHKFIDALPEGYKSVVGERGVKLSGGERQRIALARVFLEDPPVLILDEATSALDSKTEHDLQIALEEVMKGRTSLVIAHRLSTVMAANEILVMDQGEIVDRGSHSELIKRDGLYKDYWNIQAGGYKDMLN
jgi:subfamily B ATP-binding cassette protein MsbA